MQKNQAFCLCMKTVFCCEMEMQLIQNTYSFARYTVQLALYCLGWQRAKFRLEPPYPVGSNKLHVAKIDVQDFATISARSLKKIIPKNDQHYFLLSCVEERPRWPIQSPNKGRKKEVKGYEERGIRSSLLILDLEDGRL